MKHPVKRAFFGLLAGCLAAVSAVVSAAEEKAALPEPAEIIKRAETAIKDAKVVRYKFTREGLHDDAEKSPKASGTVFMSGYSRKYIEKFRLDATLEPPGSTEKEKLTAGGDGDLFYLVDYKSKKVYADMDPAVFGSQSETLFANVPQTFVSPDPFEYEKRAEKTEVKGIVQLNKEDCYEVHFAFGGGHFEAAYLFSVKDGLPKRFDWAWDGPSGGRMGNRLVLSELTLDAPSSADTFKLSVPEGFTKTNEFAP